MKEKRFGWVCTLLKAPIRPDNTLVIKWLLNLNSDVAESLEKESTYLGLQDFI